MLTVVCRLEIAIVKFCELYFVTQLYLLLSVAVYCDQVILAVIYLEMEWRCPLAFVTDEKVGHNSRKADLSMFDIDTDDNNNRCC